MPVPELEAPTATPEALPVPQVPTPPLGAFGGVDLGAGLSKLGDELFGEGWQEYHRAAEAKAQEAEATFQQGALQLRDNYKNLSGEDAVKAHQQYSENLEKLRSQIGQTLYSKYGQAVYNNNSLRRAQFAQEGIDAHFEQQNRVFQFGSFKTLQNGDVKSAAKVADTYPASEKELGFLLDGSEKRARAQYSQLGYPADAVDAFAKQARSAVADAFVTALAKMKSPALPDVVSKYGKDLDEKQLESAQFAVSGASAQQAAKEAVYGSVTSPIPRQSTDPRFHDADGLPSESVQRSRLEDYLKTATPAQGRIALSEFDRLRTNQLKEFRDTVKTNYDKIIADGQLDDNGQVRPFALDSVKSANELKWMYRNANVKNDVVGEMNLESIFKLSTDNGKRAYSADHIRDAQSNEASIYQLRANLVNMHNSDPDAFKKFSADPTSLQLEMGRNDKYPAGFHGMTGLKDAQAVLKGLQSRNPDELKAYGVDIKQEVESRYSGTFSGGKRREAVDAATNYALDHFKPGMDRADVRNQLKEFLSGDWEDYRPSPKVAVTRGSVTPSQPAPAKAGGVVDVKSKDERDKLPPGTKYRRPNDPNIYTVGGK